MEGLRNRGLPLADDLVRLHERLMALLYRSYESPHSRFMELVAEAWRMRGSMTESG